MVSHRPQYGHQLSQGWSPTIQNLPEGIEVPWMVSHHPQDIRPPSQGWSPTIQNIIEKSVLQALNLASRLN